MRIRTRSTMIIIGFLAVWGTLAVGSQRAASQTAFENGAFVLDRDGNAWAVLDGNRHPLVFVDDEQDLLSSLPKGRPLVSLFDRPGGTPPTAASSAPPTVTSTPAVPSEISITEPSDGATVDGFPTVRMRTTS